MQHFASQGVNWWTGVVWITCGLLWCLSPVWTLILTHPFIAEDPLWASDSIQNFPNLFTRRNKLICILDVPKVNMFSAGFIFGWTTSLIFNNIIKLTSVTLLDENLNWTELDNDKTVGSRSCSIMLLDLIILLAIICVFTLICPLLFLCFRTEVDVGACSTWNVWSASPVKSAVCSWSPQTPPSPVLSLCPSRPGLPEQQGNIQFFTTPVSLIPTALESCDSTTHSKDSQR